MSAKSLPVTLSTEVEAFPSLVRIVKALGYEIEPYPDEPELWGIWKGQERATSEAYRSEADAYAEALGWIVQAELEEEKKPASTE